MSSPIPLPPRLRYLAEHSDRSGGQQQKPIGWSHRSWRQWLPDLQDLFDKLPEGLDRSAAAAYAAAAHSGTDEAVGAFVVSMVWGYGSVGYGPYRTARVLRARPQAAATLAEVARRVRDNGGPAAFEWLAANRLRGLGVAFATKYLCFCSMAARAEADPGAPLPAPALILDRLVHGWLAAHAGWAPSLNWSVPDYRCYVSSVESWASELGFDPFTVEYLMFRDAVAARPGSQWAASGAEPERDQGLSQPLAAEETAESDPILAAIEHLIDVFDENSDGWPEDDVHDFELGVRQLQRIVLVRPWRRT